MRTVRMFLYKVYENMNLLCIYVYVCEFLYNDCMDMFMCLSSINIYVNMYEFMHMRMCPILLTYVSGQITGSVVNYIKLM